MTSTMNFTFHKEEEGHFATDDDDDDNIVDNDDDNTTKTTVKRVGKMVHTHTATKRE